VTGAERTSPILASSLVALLLAAPGATALAQRGPASVECDGRIVSAIDIRTHPPRFSDTATVRGSLMQAERSLHATTRPGVAAAYLRLEVGRGCTERDRSESERLLRAQPFLAYAAVRTRPDGPGRVRVEVETVDEVPVIIGGGLRHGTVSSLTLGTENYSGRGLTVAVSYENGFAFRDGFGLRAVQYGAFGRPYTLAAHGAQHPLGDSWSLELAEPFLTDLQYRGFHLGAGGASDHYAVLEPTGERVALNVGRMTYDFAIFARVNPVGRGGPAGLLGAAFLGENVNVGSTTVIVTDTGLLPAPAGAQLDGRYPASNVTRVAAIAGIRSVRFLTVRGFDALTAAQDVGVGLQLDALAGPSVRSNRATNDVFLASGLYWGAGSERSFLQLRAIGEGRSSRDSPAWSGVVANGRLTWYRTPAPTRTRLVSLELSAVRHLSFPLQLTFRDGEGGLPGYGGATFAGGTRAVARLEERRVFRPFGAAADVAAAAFLDAGQLWAGDVPYGRGSGLRGALGVSLLGAYPSGGKRTYRLDVAVPLNPASGARFEVRISSSDRTGRLWREPADVARARAGAVPSNLLTWLPR